MEGLISRTVMGEVVGEDCVRGLGFGFCVFCWLPFLKLLSILPCCPLVSHGRVVWIA